MLVCLGQIAEEGVVLRVVHVGDKCVELAQAVRWRRLQNSNEKLRVHSKDPKILIGFDVLELGNL